METNSTVESGSMDRSENGLLSGFEDGLEGEGDLNAGRQAPVGSPMRLCSEG